MKKRQHKAFVVVFKATQGPNNGCWVYSNSHPTREDAERWISDMQRFYSDKEGNPTLDYAVLSYDERFAQVGWWEREQKNTSVHSSDSS